MYSVELVCNLSTDVIEGMDETECNCVYACMYKMKELRHFHFFFVF
jgi:hypothetical protein